MREQPLFQSGEKNQRKLQALGGVQAHELHAVLPGLGLGFAGFERGMGQERRQRFQAIGQVRLVGAHGVGQFFQVLDPHFGLFAFVVAMKVEQAAGVQHLLGLLAEVEACGVFAQTFDEIEKTF